jgi:hypothetical protein
MPFCEDGQVDAKTLLAFEVLCGQSARCSVLSDPHTVPVVIFVGPLSRPIASCFSAMCRRMDGKLVGEQSFGLLQGP